MTFRWRFEPTAPVADSTPDVGAVTPVAEPSFVSQSDAESWLGENWRELAAAGVVQVTLVEGDGTTLVPLYEMSLLAD